MYTISEIAREFKVNERTVRRWIADGRVIAVHVGGSVRIMQDEVDKMKRGEAAICRKVKNEL